MALYEDIFEMWVASNGKDAIQMYYNWKLDILVLDLMMPQMDGLAVLEEIRELHGDTSTAIIIVSILEFEREPCSALEIQGFIAKPIKVGEIGKQVLDCYQALNSEKAKVALEEFQELLGKK